MLYFMNIDINYLNFGDDDYFKLSIGISIRNVQRSGSIIELLPSIRWPFNLKFVISHDINIFVACVNIILIVKDNFMGIYIFQAWN